METLTRRTFIQATAATSTVGGYLLTAGRLNAAGKKSEQEQQPLDLSALLDERSKATRAAYVSGIGVSAVTDIPEDAPLKLDFSGDVMTVQVGPAKVELDVVVHVDNPIGHHRWLLDTLARKVRTEALRSAREARTGMPQVDASTAMLMVAFEFCTVPHLDAVPPRANVAAELGHFGETGHVWQRWTDENGDLLHEAASKVTVNELLVARMNQEQFADVLTAGLAFAAAAAGAEGSAAHIDGMQAMLARVSNRPFAARLA